MLAVELVALMLVEQQVLEVTVVEELEEVLALAMLVLLALQILAVAVGVAPTTELTNTVATAAQAS